jgi:hypothetical protein
VASVYLVQDMAIVQMVIDLPIRSKLSFFIFWLTIDFSGELI